MTVYFLNLNPTKMNLSFSQLPEHDKNLLKRITREIFQSINPEYLFCYGSRTGIYHTRTCFATPAKTVQYEHQYDLAVIINEHDPRPDEQLLLLAKKAGCFCHHINIVLHRRDTVAKLLSEGDFFFLRLFTHAIPLHQPRPAPINLSILQLVAGQQTLTHTITIQALQLLANGLQLADTAAKAQQEGNAPTALYLVNQSVQASLRAMLMACTGYQPKSATLHTLLNHTRNFTIEAAAVFPRNTKEELMLFRLISSRQTRAVGAPIVSCLLQRAGKMNEVAAIIINESGRMPVDSHGSEMACA